MFWTRKQHNTMGCDNDIWTLPHVCHLCTFNLHRSWHALELLSVTEMWKVAEYKRKEAKHTLKWLCFTCASRSYSAFADSGKPERRSIRCLDTFFGTDSRIHYDRIYGGSHCADTSHSWKPYSGDRSTEKESPKALEWTKVSHAHAWHCS